MTDCVYCGLPTGGPHDEHEECVERSMETAVDEPRRPEMPYIIETTTPEMSSYIEPGQPWPRTVSRRAVATLEEAQREAWTIVADSPTGADHSLMEWRRDAANVPAEGGTIGPLPDGGVIEVRQVSWTSLRTMSGIDESSVPGSRPDSDIIPAFNA